MRWISQISSVLLCLVILSSLSLPGLAQSIPNSNTPVNKRNSQTKDKQFAKKFWNYLLSNNYKHWSPAAGKTADHFAIRAGADGAASPHGGMVKSYVNRTAASNPNSLPVGSILILENYRQDKSLDTISVMYRTPGFNPAGNDWYWVNYNADGSITSEGTGRPDSLGPKGIRQASATAPLPKKLVGRSLTCIQCHSSGGSDLAFFNNQRNTKSQFDPENAIVPLIPPPAKPETPVFKPKLEIRPAAIVDEGPLQNFILKTDQQATTGNFP